MKNVIDIVRNNGETSHYFTELIIKRKKSNISINDGRFVSLRITYVKIRYQ